MQSTHFAVVMVCNLLSKELLLAFLKIWQYEKNHSLSFQFVVFFFYILLGNNEPHIKYKNYLLENKTIKRCFTTGTVWKPVILRVWDTLNLSVSKKVTLAFSKRTSLSSFKVLEPAPVLSNVDRDLAQECDGLGTLDCQSYLVMAIVCITVLSSSQSLCMDHLCALE